MNRHKTIKINDIEIDAGISELIKTLWENDIETVQCCEGGYFSEKETRFTHLENDKIIENAHIIFYKKDLEKIKKFLPSDTDYIIGDKNRTGHISEWIGSFDGAWANFVNISIGRKLDILFKLLDEYCFNGDFESCDKYIENFDIEKFSVTESLGVLTITLVWKSRLTKREKFYDDVYEYVYKHFPDEEAESIMIGLK